MDEKTSTPTVTPAKPATGTGLDPKVAALLSWAFAPLSSIIFIVMEKDDKFVKFHAYESLLVAIAVIVASVVASMLVVVLIGIVLVPAVSIAAFVLWIMGMMKAYKGEMWKLPVIGDMAEEWANK